MAAHTLTDRERRILSEMLTHTQLTALRAGLQHMLSPGFKPDLHVGICMNLDGVVWREGGAHILVSAVSRSWPHPRNTGCSAYPVPDYIAGVPDKWEGEQLELRRDLMQHAIRVIDAYLEQQPCTAT